MAFDPVLVSNTREWVVLAKEDLAAAELTLAANVPLIRTALFHCQQSVEKALKAFLTWRDVPFRKTHNLEELGEACARLDPALTPFINRVTLLNKYGVQFRYPGASSEPTLADARQALRLVDDFVEAVLTKFPPQVFSQR